MKNQRLTKRNGINYIARNQYCDYNAVLTDAQLEAANQQCVDKLGQLEDIEEEIGIDLITLFKALTNGVWIKNKVGQIYHTNIYLHNLKLSYFSDKNDFCLMTSDNTLLLFNRIKQDWALTKEELELI